MSAVEQVLLGWVLVTVMMSVLWGIQRRTRDAGIVDVGWAAGIGLLAILYATTSGGDPARRFLVATLAAIWSFRLAIYLLFNRVIGKPEDGRYQRLRAHWGPKAQPYLFLFFQAQALLDIIFSLPFLVLVRNQAPALSGWEVAGVLVWITAVVGESLADWQLARFRADPANRGKTCREGLWGWSRHPNYFFEWTHWWTYVFMGVGASFGYVTLFAPALMLYLLFKVTGIPYTEAQAVASRGEDYRRYQRTTSAFVPWFPRKGGR